LNRANLDVSQTPNFAIPAAQTLAGSGSVIGSLTVNGTLVPDPSPSASPLIFSNNLALAGNTIIGINPADRSTARIQVLGNLRFGGTLTVTNAGGTETVKVFSAASYTGAFASISLPKQSGDSRWDASRLSVDGTLSLVTTPAPPQILPVTLSNGIVVIPFATSTGRHYILQSTLSLGPSQHWTSVTTVSGNGGIMNIHLQVPPAQPQRFFRVQVY